MQCAPYGIPSPCNFFNVIFIIILFRRFPTYVCHCCLNHKLAAICSLHVHRQKWDGQDGCGDGTSWCHELLSSVFALHNTMPTGTSLSPLKTLNHQFLFQQTAFHTGSSFGLFFSPSTSHPLQKSLLRMTSLNSNTPMTRNYICRCH